MKAKRRHELQHNVLDAELGKIVEFFKKRGSLIAWGILVAALVVFLIIYVRGRGVRVAETLQANYDRWTIEYRNQGGTDKVLEGFQTLAEQTDDERIAALASVRIGDIYATKLRAGGPRSDSERAAFHTQAKTYYERVLSQFPDQTLAVAKSRFGLAKLAESQTPPDIETARSYYRKIVATQQLLAQPVMAEAQGSLDRLEEILEPIPMATTAPVVETQPASQPATASTSLPAGK